MRIQYEITDTRDGEIKKAMRVCGIRTKRGFLDEAVTLFISAINEKRMGRKVVSSDDENLNSIKGIREFLMPPLEHAKCGD